MVIGASWASARARKELEMEVVSGHSLSGTSDLSAASSYLPDSADPIGSLSYRVDFSAAWAKPNSVSS